MCPDPLQGRPAPRVRHHAQPDPGRGQFRYPGRSDHVHRRDECRLPGRATAGAGEGGRPAIKAAIWEKAGDYMRCSVVGRTRCSRRCRRHAEAGRAGVLADEDLPGAPHRLHLTVFPGRAADGAAAETHGGIPVEQLCAAPARWWPRCGAAGCSARVGPAPTRRGTCERSRPAADGQPLAHPATGLRTEPGLRVLVR